MSNTMNGQVIMPQGVDPVKDLAKEIIARAMLDAMGLITNSSCSGLYEKKRFIEDAKNWFVNDSRDFKLVCELAGAEPYYIKELFGDFQYNYNAGKLKNLNPNIVVKHLLRKL